MTLLSQNEGKHEQYNGVKEQLVDSDALKVAFTVT